MRLKSKVAIITGGSSGIGKAISVLFAKEGAQIIIADINISEGEKTVKELQKLTNSNHVAYFVHCDVLNREHLKKMFEFAKQQFGRPVDIMCNNAGIGLVPEGVVEEPDSRKWKMVLDIDLTAVIEGTQLAIKEMKDSGRGGVIINTASMGGFIPMELQPVYASAKAGVIHFTRSLAYLNDSDNIRVVAICPTFTETALMDAWGKENIELAKSSVGGILSPENVANGVLELALDENNKGGGAIMRVRIKGRDYWQPPGNTNYRSKL